jgi:carboxypeptidase family protein
MLRTLLLNRFALTLGGILGLVLFWNIYVGANNDGLLYGQIVDANGTPIAGATVEAVGKKLALSAPVGQTTTDEDGRFSFEGLEEYSFVVSAKLDGASSRGRLVRLWFKGQNYSVSPPIVLGPKPNK